MRDQSPSNENDDLHTALFLARRIELTNNVLTNVEHKSCLNIWCRSDTASCLHIELEETAVPLMTAVAVS